jgi:hypothetical protein
VLTFYHFGRTEKGNKGLCGAKVKTTASVSKQSEEDGKAGEFARTSQRVEKASEECSGVVLASPSKKGISFEENF